MVKVSVREKNGFDRLRFEANFTDESADKERLADQTSINHHTGIAINQQKTIAHDAANGVQI